MSETSLPLAGFQVIIIGRFWVITEVSPSLFGQFAYRFPQTGISIRALYVQWSLIQNQKSY